MTKNVILLQSHILVKSVCYNDSASGEHKYIGGRIDMEEPKEEIFIRIFDTLTPENRARLAVLLEAVVHNQATSSDSPQTEMKTK